MRLRKGSTVTDDAGFVSVPQQDGKRSRREATVVAEAPVAAPVVRPDGWQPLGELLMARDAVDHPQVAEALLQQAASGKRVGALLVELGAISERDLAEALAEQLSLALVDLGTETPDPEAVAVIPESFARAHQCIPMMRTQDAIIIAVADPSDALAVQLQSQTRLDVTLVVAPGSEVRRAIDQSYRSLEGIDQFVKAFEATSSTKKAVALTSDSQQDDAPVVQVVNKIISQALRDRASDVHIEPQDNRLRIRFRIDGALHDVLALPDAMGPALVSRLKIMAGMNIVERRRPQDGQIAMDVDGRAVDIRVATTGVIWGEKVVLRILDKSRPLYKLSDLGMPAKTHETFSKLVRAPFGMVLCAGPTGAGKTTTLYATMSEINESQSNIMTIEDPVEYVFPSINQISTNEQAGLTFSTGLKSILRQDPDVILVGEIRDVDTARIATQAALTGHFVLSSLHATDAVAALHRFLDMGIESFLIASSVLGVVGQRLLRRNCTKCLKAYKPGAEEIAFYSESGGAAKTKFYKGIGCNFCSGTGFSDRIGVYELLTVTPEIKRLVVGWATQDELRRMAVKQGMRTLNDEAIALVEQDLTTIPEVIRHIYTA
ncbi:MAG: type pilus assembly protein PilB [Frankiales bacterium]|jgi:type IV pilus assembly protein PilB|nr:type pilus assembly protein PilB [Frankiales bacterium]